MDPIISGVPQGSVSLLGSLLLILFLNDLPNYVYSFSPGIADNSKFYADNIKNYCIVNT